MPIPPDLKEELLQRTEQVAAETHKLHEDLATWTSPPSMIAQTVMRLCWQTETLARVVKQLVGSQ